MKDKGSDLFNYIILGTVLVILIKNGSNINELKTQNAKQEAKIQSIENYLVQDDHNQLGRFNVYNTNQERLFSSIIHQDLEINKTPDRYQSGLYMNFTIDNLDDDLDNLKFLDIKTENLTLKYTLNQIFNDYQDDFDQVHDNKTLNDPILILELNIKNHKNAPVFLVFDLEEQLSSQ